MLSISVELSDLIGNVCASIKCTVDSYHSPETSSRDAHIDTERGLRQLMWLFDYLVYCPKWEIMNVVCYTNFKLIWTVILSQKEEMSQ